MCNSFTGPDVDTSLTTSMFVMCMIKTMARLNNNNETRATRLHNNNTSRDARENITYEIMYCMTDVYKIYAVSERMNDE